MYANKVSDTNAYDASLAQLHPHMTNWLTSVEVPMWKIQIQMQKIQTQIHPRPHQGHAKLADISRSANVGNVSPEAWTSAIEVAFF